MPYTKEIINYEFPQNIWGTSLRLTEKKCSLAKSIETNFPGTKKLQEQDRSEFAQSCPTLCDPVDCSLPDSSVHGNFQARVLEWLAISFSRRPSWPRDWTQVSRIAGRRFTIWATRDRRQIQILIKASLHLMLYVMSFLPNLVSWHFRSSPPRAIFPIKNFILTFQTFPPSYFSLPFFIPNLHEASCFLWTLLDRNCSIWPAALG